ncbi:MAG: M14 family zinc carboxypeptidase [Corynebacterium glutamicum]|nr:M14 family zinc carboxypeptidase [Corynebacterium glutamicum]
MLPQTPWEQGGTWATPAEEETYLQDVANALPNVHIEVIGRTWLGSLPIHQAIIGNAPDDAPTVLVVGGQHGYEPMGREAALHFIRDAAAMPATNRIRVVCIPTASPQGAILNIRNTPTPVGGRDMNRDHLKMEAYETHALQQAVTRFQPAAIVDCHEWAITGNNSPEVWTKGSAIAGADSEVRALAAEMNDAVRAALSTAGVPNGPYAQSTDPTIFSNNSALRHAVSMLIETPREHPAEDRANGYAVSLKAILDWVDDNADRVVEVTDGARVRKAVEGAHRKFPFDIGTEILSPPPESYRNLVSWPIQLDILGIQGDVTEVTMAQPSQPLIPWLLDASSQHAVTGAERYAPELPKSDYAPSMGGTPERIRVHWMGATVDIDAVRLGTGSGSVTVWERPY